MKILWIWVLAMSLIFAGCSGDQNSVSTDTSEYIVETNTASAESASTTYVENETDENETVENEATDNKNQSLVDIIGEETKVHEYIMPNHTDMFFEELEKTYEGIERLQITYSVALDYEEVLAYYQALTNRPNPDYTNAYGYFFDDVFLGDEDDYIEQILVQGLFNKTEVIMIIQNTSHQGSNQTQTDHATVSVQIDFEHLQVMPQFDDATPQASLVANASDIITVDDQQQGLEMWQSAQHKGFESFEGQYLVKEFDWQNYAGEETWSVTESTRTIWLREDYVAEKHVVDEMNTTYRYYDPDRQISYEASELVADPSESDQNILMGNMIYLPAIQEDLVISHNPLVVPAHLKIKECYLTELVDKPMLYVLKEDEEQPNKKWIKQWISLEYGVIVQEEIYSEDFKLVNWSVLESMTTEEMPYYLFMPRQDVAYKDMTLSLFFRNNHYSEDFRDGFQATFMQGFFDIDLIVEESGELIQLTFDGNRMETMAERRIVKNMNEEEIEVISFREGDAFKVAVPSKEEVYLYPSSIHEHQWFQLDALGFRERVETNEEIIYTFEKNDQGSVNGYVNQYDYIINKTNKKFEKIIQYAKDPFDSSNEREREAIYTIQNLRASSDQVFSRVASYNEYYIFAHDDGESPPPWWE